MAYGTRITASLPTAGQVQWSGTLNTVLTAITGVLAQAVTPGGMSFAANLDMAGNAMTDLSGVLLNPSLDTGTPRSLLFANTGSLVTGDMYIRDGINRLIHLTSSGSISQGSAGGFTGPYPLSGAYFATSSIGVGPAGEYWFTTNGTASFPFAASGMAGINAGTLIASTLWFPSGSGNPPANGYQLVVADSTGTWSTEQSGTFTTWIDVAAAIPVIGGSSYSTAGAWGFTQANAQLDLALPFVQGDQLQSVVLVAGISGLGPITASLNARQWTGENDLTVARITAGSGAPLNAVVTMSNGAYTMTGTLPHTPGVTGSLVLTVGGNTSQNLYAVYATWLRKVI